VFSAFLWLFIDAAHKIVPLAEQRLKADPVPVAS